MAWTYAIGRHVVGNIHICVDEIDPNDVAGLAQTILHEASHKFGKTIHSELDPVQSAYHYERVDAIPSPADRGWIEDNVLPPWEALPQCELPTDGADGGWSAPTTRRHVWRLFRRPSWQRARGRLGNPRRPITTVVVRRCRLATKFHHGARRREPSGDDSSLAAQEEPVGNTFSVGGLAALRRGCGCEEGLPHSELPYNEIQPWQASAPEHVDSNGETVSTYEELPSWVEEAGAGTKMTARSPHRRSRSRTRYLRGRTCHFAPRMQRRR